MSRSGFFDFREQHITKKSFAPAPPAGLDEKPLTVTSLTRKIELALSVGLPPIVSVIGEVSNFKFHRPSGHFYFTLKDEKSCIDCVMYRSDAERLKFAIDDGMELVATGSVRVYGARGRYQLVASTIQPVGKGALELAFQQLHAKLEKLGLFSPERKKPLPLFPRKIALVTSRQTAALQDMLKVLRKFPWIQLAVYHVPVQGEGAHQPIAAAIAHLSRTASAANIDLIILARGGGSLEDLWSFNEEIVARAIADCRIPIITGIGHEVDTSIADLVADYHAHTPTEAAQIAVAQWRTAQSDLESMEMRMRRVMRIAVQDARQRLLGIERHEVFRRPLDRINAQRQLLDDRQRSLTLGISHRLRRSAERLSKVEALFQKCHPRNQLILNRQRLRSLQTQFIRGVNERQRTFHLKLNALERHLNAIGPRQVLERGYSITSLKRGGAIVKSSAQIKAGDKIVTRFADGTVNSTVEDSRQMNLFE